MGYSYLCHQVRELADHILNRLQSGAVEFFTFGKVDSHFASTFKDLAWWVEEDFRLKVESD